MFSRGSQLEQKVNGVVLIEKNGSLLHEIDPSEKLARKAEELGIFSETIGIRGKVIDFSMKDV